jgi:hypothetical protein
VLVRVRVNEAVDDHHRNQVTQLPVDRVKRCCLHAIVCNGRGLIRVSPTPRAHLGYPDLPQWHALIRKHPPGFAHLTHGCVGEPATDGLILFAPIRVKTHDGE